MGPQLRSMALMWTIAIVLLISWAVGFTFLGQYAPWIHLPLVLAGVAIAAILTRRRPREHRPA
jgi:hypothetical protein